MSVLAPSKQRNATVFGMAVTELFVLLLFFVVFLWIATAPAKTLPPNLRIAALEEKVNKLEADIKKLKHENHDLRLELRERDDQLKLLWEIYKKKPVPVTPGTPEWRKFLNEWYKELQNAATTGGRGHANCLGVGAGALLRLTIFDDGIAVQAVYGDGDRALVETVPAIRELIAMNRVSVSQLDEFGGRILQWSDSRKPACRFDVTYVDKATQKAPYVAALRVIDRSFYKSERRG